MSKVVYTWPYDTAIPPKEIDLEGNNCHTCKFAVITLIGECNKKINGKYVHQDGLCPSAWWCKYYQRASQQEIEDNSFDWSKAKRIYIN